VLRLLDLSIVVDLIQKGLNVFHKYENLIWAIKQLLLKDWIVNLQHTLCEGNDVIDFLSKKSALSDGDFVVFHKTP